MLQTQPLAEKQSRAANQHPKGQPALQSTLRIVKRNIAARKSRIIAKVPTRRRGAQSQRQRRRCHCRVLGDGDRKRCCGLSPKQKSGEGRPTYSRRGQPALQGRIIIEKKNTAARKSRSVAEVVTRIRGTQGQRQRDSSIGRGPIEMDRT